MFWKRESITWKENLKSSNCARIRFFVPLNHVLDVVAIKLLVVSLWDLRRYDIVYLTTADSPTFVQVFSIVVFKIVSTVLGFLRVFIRACLMTREIRSFWFVFQSIVFNPWTPTVPIGGFYVVLKYINLIWYYLQWPISSKLYHKPLKCYTASLHD